MAVKLGAVGDLGVEGRQKWDHCGRTRIAQIISSYSTKYLHTLQITYFNDDGASFTTETIGSPDFPGPFNEVITFKGETEYVTGIEGLFSNFSFWSLRIRTNIEVYKLVSSNGCDDATGFKFSFGESNRFGGLYGTQRQNGIISSIGAYVNPFKLKIHHLKDKVAAEVPSSDSSSEDEDGESC